MGKTLEQALQKWGYPNTNIYEKKKRLASLQTTEVHMWTTERYYYTLSECD